MSYSVKKFPFKNISEIHQFRKKIQILLVRHLVMAKTQLKAMDISELQWHVKREKQELASVEEKLHNAATINKRLKR